MGDEPLCCANVLSKGSGIRVLAGYLDGVAVPVMANRLWIVSMSGRDFSIVLVNMTDRINSSFGDECFI